jgi:cephalosporin hydroxylase
LKLTIDTEARTLSVDEGATAPRVPLYSAEAFALLSRLWVKVGWNQKYSYGFTWMGRPIIQLPEDIVRIQEAIYRIRPDVIVETGVAHGGSLVFYASLLKALGRGRVVGIDVDIRPHNRAAIESHEFAPLISLIEGSSTDPKVVSQARSLIQGAGTVLVILDSDHSRAHVAAELEAYASFVTVGSYIVATDGIMNDLHDVPRGRSEWREDNAVAAVEAFVAKHPEFVVEPPPFGFNETNLGSLQLTHWPSAYVKRLS